MDTSNLASIFSPTLMRPPTDSESLQNAFQELRRSKSILNLLLIRAEMKENEENLSFKSTPDVLLQNLPISIENLQTNSALLNSNLNANLNSNNLNNNNLNNNNYKDEIPGSSSSSSTTPLPPKSTSLFSTANTLPPHPPCLSSFSKSVTSSFSTSNNSLVSTTATAPLSENSVEIIKKSGTGSNTAPFHLLSPSPISTNMFISTRKRQNVRPMSVSLDSSMLSSFLSGEKSKETCGKLSPIKEYETNSLFNNNEVIRHLNNNSGAGFDGSLSTNNDGNNKDKNVKDKGRNSMGSAGMKSLPVKKISTRARPMSTSAATSTSLSFFLKMFMSPRDNVETTNNGNGNNGNLNTMTNPSIIANNSGNINNNVTTNSNNNNSGNNGNGNNVNNGNNNGNGSGNGNNNGNGNGNTQTPIITRSPVTPSGARQTSVPPSSYRRSPSNLVSNKLTRP